MDEPACTRPGQAHYDRRDSRPGSRTPHGLGTWGDRRRHRDHLLGRLPRLGTPARQLRRLLAPDPAARPHRRHRPGHRRDRPRLRHRRRARGSAARRLRQPPRDGLPGLLGRCTSATPGSSSARAWPEARASPRRSPRTRACSPPSPPPSFGPVHSRRMRGKTVLPCRPRRDANAAPLPARPGHLLPDPPHRGRSPARPADVRRLLRLHRRRAVQRLGGEAVAPVHHLPAPPPGPPAWASPRSSSAPCYGSATSRWPNTRPAASSTSTP